MSFCLFSNRIAVIRRLGWFFWTKSANAVHGDLRSPDLTREGREIEETNRTTFVTRRSNSPRMFSDRVMRALEASRQNAQGRFASILERLFFAATAT